MTSPQENAREEALGWFVRLQDQDAGQADWTAFTVWLDAHPDNRDIYAQIEAVWVDLDLAEEPTPSDSGAGNVVAFRRPKASKIPWIAGGIGALAASILVALALTQSGSSTQTYQTGPREMRTLALADGSKIQLNGGSDIRVHLGSRLRSVVLVSGEASFDVAHNANRPFVVSVGDREVEVVGTEFNILRHDSDLQVTVRRGIVAVGPKAGKVEARLVAGQQLDHRDGAPGIQVRTVDPNDALSWRSGDRKSTRLNSSHVVTSRMPSSA